MPEVNIEEETPHNGPRFIASGDLLSQGLFKLSTDDMKIPGKECCDFGGKVTIIKYLGLMSVH